MKKMMCAALIAATMMTSCTRRLIDFTVISSKNVGLSIDKSKGKRVKGKSMGPFGLETSCVRYV
ncbi:hypothetical protein GCM10023093_00810 [Nemorincola caseinilytica]|uniref:Lipoprotein n=1 Tax=Nemorincola caseinilytica TaxID=2054315 RepID=A0ABP8N474_9BACT